MMAVFDRLFKSRINEEVIKRVSEVEARMVEVSEQKTMEKAKEIQAQWAADFQKSQMDGDAEAKSLLHDPFQLLETLKYKERPMMLTYEVLRSMSERNPIVASVINTRVNQIASFSTPPKTPYDIGFRIHMKDDEKKPTPDDEKRIDEIEHMIENTGILPLPMEERDNFDAFLRKVVRDTLTYDQMSFECINGRGGMPVAFVAIDAATIRLATTAKYFKDIKHMKGFAPPPMIETEMGSIQKYSVKPEDIRYVQIIDGKVMTTYTEQELGFGIRNPRTSIKQNGYGVSELEILVNTVTAHLWAEEYNRRFFSQGSAPKGIIHFEGNISQEQLTSFRRQWHAQVMGVFNSWRTPVIAAPAKLQYTNLQMSNKNMEFSNWIDYLIKLICAVYLIDPAEIGFDFRGGASQTQAPLFETNQEAKQKMSRDRGLRPLLKFIQTEINKNIVFRLYDGRYEFEFLGLDSKTEEQLQEMHLKEVQNFKLVDEIRAEYDLPPLGHDRGGDIIMNASYLNYMNQLQMQKMQEQQPGGDMGGEDFGDSGGGDFGQPPGEGQPDEGSGDFGQEIDMGDYGEEQ
jgi:hypothetical protein